jgi:hypothetical protein
MTDNDKDGEGSYRIVRSKRASHDTPHDVFVSRLLRPVEEFKLNLIRQGMSAARADQVILAVPCFVKRGVSLTIAKRYKQAFEAAGAWAQVIAHDEPMVDRLDSEPKERAGWSQVDLPRHDAEAGTFGAEQTGRQFVLPAPEESNSWSAPLPDKIELDDEPVDDFQLDHGPMASYNGPFAKGSGTTPTPTPTPEPPSDHLTLDGVTENPPSSKYVARGARELEKPRFSLNLPPPAPEKPWLVRNKMKLIFGALFVLIATYCYGCSQVMSQSVAFRSDIGDVNRRLEMQNAKGQEVTDADVIYHVRMIGHENGLSIDEDDVEVTAHELGQAEMGTGKCKMLNGNFDLIQKLPQSEIDFIMKSSGSCMVPDAIIEIKIRATAKWGINSRDIDLDRYTWVAKYDFTQ